MQAKKTAEETLRRMLKDLLKRTPKKPRPKRNRKQPPKAPEPTTNDVPPNSLEGPPFVPNRNGGDDIPDIQRSAWHSYNIADTSVRALANGLLGLLRIQEFGP